MSSMCSCFFSNCFEHFSFGFFFRRSKRFSVNIRRSASLMRVTNFSAFQPDRIDLKGSCGGCTDDADLSGNFVVSA